ncbi:hypothetical protein ABPG75_003989 [Micractinium tetrahymenae]
MGNAQAHAAPQLRVVAALSGAAPLPLTAPEWQQLLTHASPLSRLDPGEVEREIRPHCAELVYNNAQTLNLQRFIYLVARQLRRARRQGGAGGVVATANAVYCLRTILKDLMEQLNSTQLVSFIELPPDVAAPAAEAGVAAAQVPDAAAPAAPAAELGAEGSEGGASPGGSSTAGSPGQAGFAQLHNGSLVHTLVREAMLTLADAHLLAGGGYMLLLECGRLLLALFSSALYSPTARGALGQHPYFDAAMQQNNLANTVVEALLRLFITAPPLPLSHKIFNYMPTDTRSVLRVVRTAAASVLWLPYQAYTLLLRPARPSASGDADAAAAPSNSPLGDSALLLLLVLLFHAPPQDAPFGNPYRQSLARLQDADDIVTADAAEGGRTAGSGDAAISYAALYEALGASLTSERVVLLLYTLLHGCPHFHEYCLVRSDLDTILLPLLELLYSAHERTANQMYMLLIVLLMLSQDSAFAQNIHRITLQSVPFYRERSTRTTLGSLLVVLLLRTAHYNLAKLRDVYLHTNTLAALANLAPHMSGMSTHAAQRLVSLFHLLARRYNRLQAAAEGAAMPPTPTTAYAAADSPLTPWLPAPTSQQQALQGAHQAAAQAGEHLQQDAQQAAPQAQHAEQQQGAQQQGAEQQHDQQPLQPWVEAVAQQQAPAAGAGVSEQQELQLQLYADFLRIVLEIINSILTSSLSRNPELVYTLLHRQEVFAPFVHHPRYAELMENITRVTDYFNRRVEEHVAAAGGAAQLSGERVLDLIKQHSRGWRRDRLKPFPELRFTYEEEASPEEFFVPYVWSLAVAQGHVQALQRWLLLGGNPSALDRHSGRGTLLYSAAHFDQAESIKVLIKAGADVNAVSKLRGSALHAAAAHKSGRSVQALLDGGANPLLLDCQGRTAIAVAEAKGHKAAAGRMRAAVPRFQAAAAAAGDHPGSSPRDERIPAMRPSPLPAADSVARDSPGLRSFESHLSGASHRSEAAGSHRSAVAPACAAPSQVQGGPACAGSPPRQAAGAAGAAAGAAAAAAARGQGTAHWQAALWQAGQAAVRQALLPVLPEQQQQQRRQGAHRRRLWLPLLGRPPGLPGRPGGAALPPPLCGPHLLARHPGGCTAGAGGSRRRWGAGAQPVRRRLGGCAARGGGGRVCR